MNSGIIPILIMIYFIPAAVASIRKKRNFVAIALTNFFFGWTLVGWAVTLIWAVTKD